MIVTLWVLLGIGFIGIAFHALAPSFAREHKIFAPGRFTLPSLKGREARIFALSMLAAAIVMAAVFLLLPVILKPAPVPIL